jgi:hypothetical protein
MLKDISRNIDFSFEVICSFFHEMSVLSCISYDRMRTGGF